MTRIEMVEHAMQVLGDAAAEELTAFVEEKHGKKIEARFLPLFLASIRSRKHLEASRRERTIARQTEAAPTTTAADVPQA